MPDLVVRPLADADLPALPPLLAALGYVLAPTEIAARARLVAATPGHALLAGERDGRVVALMHLYGRPAIEKPPEAVVQALVVAPGTQGHGVGRRMMDAAEAWAARQGYRSVALASAVERSGAHAFYERLGYRRVATSHLMRKDLADRA